MVTTWAIAMQTSNEIPDWRITGDWWDLCNCAIGCPCNFGSDPTYGFCDGVLTWLIRDGNYGALNFHKDLAYAKDDKERDGSRFAVEPHAHHCAVAVSYTHLTLPTIYSV